MRELMGTDTLLRGLTTFVSKVFAFYFFNKNLGKKTINNFSDLIHFLCEVIIYISSRAFAIGEK